LTNQKRIARPTPKSIATYVRKNAPKVKKANQHRHGTSETVREAQYKDHHIVIRTIYDIQVDGVLITGHIGVSDDGQVHYHPVPNLSFDSAVDLVKQLIDVFPDDFVGKKQGTNPHAVHRHMTKSRPRSESTKRGTTKIKVSRR